MRSDRSDRGGGAQRHVPLSRSMQAARAAIEALVGTYWVTFQ
jgi:hypothetical protein